MTQPADQQSVARGLEIVDRLGAVDLHERLAFLEAVALGDVPLDDRGFDLRGALGRQIQRHLERRRVHLLSNPLLYATFPHTSRAKCFILLASFGPRRPRFAGRWDDSFDSNSGAKGIGKLGAATSFGGAFQRAEGLAAHGRDDPITHALLRRALLRHHEPARLADRFEDRLDVQWLQHEGVPNLQRTRGFGRRPRCSRGPSRRRPRRLRPCLRCGGATAKAFPGSRRTQPGPLLVQ